MASTESGPAEFTGVRCARAAELTVIEFHDLLKLRVDVFVVEQSCPYAELDGHDVDPDTVHLWITDPTGVAACLRVLLGSDGSRIGRVATRADVRGQGLARTLMEAAHELTGSAPTVLDAQLYLRSWYESLGYIAAGPEFVEDGIPHVAMKRTPTSPRAKETVL